MTVTKSLAIFGIDGRDICTPHKLRDNCNRPHVDWKEVDKMMSPILDHISNNLKKVVL